ncbi:MAG: ATP-binding cassette domain-containing protein [Myxococcaceae bacterium]
MPAELKVRLKHAVSAGGKFTLDVAFDAPPGITILFGPSGAGKSTTLAAIAGLVRPDQGRVEVGSEVWFDSREKVNRPVNQRGLAFVFQSLALFPHLSALGNVMFGIDRTLPRSERKLRALNMLERMRVLHLAEHRPRTFSGGEAQRVALARAFATQPKLVLLDEAFSAMDRELRRHLSDDIRSIIHELKLPAVMVTHHRNEARAVGDRVVLIEAGQIKAQGSVDALLPEVGP